MRNLGGRFRKNFFACLFGPLAVIPATLLYILVHAIFFQQTLDGQFGFFLFFMFMGLCIAYPITLVFGLPTSLLLQRFNRFNWYYLLIVVLTSVGVFTILTGNTIGAFMFTAYYSVAVALASFFLISLDRKYNKPSQRDTNT